MFSRLNFTNKMTVIAKKCVQFDNWVVNTNRALHSTTINTMQSVKKRKTNIKAHELSVCTHKKDEKLLYPSTSRRRASFWDGVSWVVLENELDELRNNPWVYSLPLIELKFLGKKEGNWRCFLGKLYSLEEFLVQKRKVLRTGHEALSIAIVVFLIKSTQTVQVDFFLNFSFVKLTFLVPQIPISYIFIISP